MTSKIEFQINLLVKKTQMRTSNTNESRGNIIVNKYLSFLDQHLKELLEGKVQDFLTLKQISMQLAISHQHLTDIIKKNTGRHPCYFYEEKILKEAKVMLKEKKLSSAEVAKILTYDPSNFSKFFKKRTGKTPGQYQKTENITIINLKK